MTLSCIGKWATGAEKEMIFQVFPSLSAKTGVWVHIGHWDQSKESSKLLLSKSKVVFNL